MAASSDDPRPGEYVDHPRYGNKPRFTAADASGSNVYLHWHSPVNDRIPGTVVKADTSKQVAATIHVTHYFDVRRTCEDCSLPFLFYAEEQKFWYEELGLRLEADCIRCVPCRRKARGVAEMRARYEELYHQDRGPQDELEFAACLLGLIRANAFGPRAEQTLRRILNRLPDGPRANQLRSEASGLYGAASDSPRGG